MGQWIHRPNLGPIAQNEAPRIHAPKWGLLHKMRTEDPRPKMGIMPQNVENPFWGMLPELTGVVLPGYCAAWHASLE